jgi:hypothetical protein
LLTNSSFSQSSNWKLIDVEKTNFSNTSLKLRKTVPTNFKIYELDTKKLKKELSFAKVNELILIEIPTVEVRDIRGRLILSKSVTSQNVTTINVASLGNALYLVTITTDSGSITSRLIVN